MRSAIVTGLLILSVAGPAAARAEDLLLFGGDGHKEFLGCLSCGEYAKDSVWSEYSKHGWKNDYGTWGEYGKYGGEYGTYSACNEYASDPPVIVDRSGKFYGRLSVSDVKRDSICGVGGNEQICIALKVMCSHA